MFAIWRRELQGYFYTPIGYVFMFVFLTLSSVMFYLQIMRQRSSDILTFIGLMSYLWMLLCPVLTMRLLAEERQKGTEKLLLTSPVTLSAIVFGKYLSALTVLLLTVLLTGVYIIVVAIYGQVWAGELMTGYLGFVLQGCAFIAVDLFISSLSKTSVTAVSLAIGVNFILWMMDILASSAPTALANIMSFLSLYSRNEPFLMGQLSPAGIVYDLSFIAIFLLLTVFWMDDRRWQRKQGA